MVIDVSFSVLVLVLVLVRTARFLGAVVAAPVGLFVAWLLLQSIPLVSPGTVMAVAVIFAAVVGYLLCWRTFR